MVKGAKRGNGDAMSISRRTFWKTLGAAVAACVAFPWAKRSTAGPDDVQRTLDWTDANVDLSDPKWDDNEYWKTPEFIGSTTNYVRRRTAQEACRDY